MLYLLPLPAFLRAMPFPVDLRGGAGPGGERRRLQGVLRQVSQLPSDIGSMVREICRAFVSCSTSGSSIEYVDGLYTQDTICLHWKR